MGTSTQVPNGLHRPLTWGDTNRKGRQAEKRQHEAEREPGDRSHRRRRGRKGKVANLEHGVASGLPWGAVSRGSGRQRQKASRQEKWQS